MLKQEKGFKTVADWRAQLLKKQGRRTKDEYRRYLINMYNRTWKPEYAKIKGRDDEAGEGPNKDMLMQQAAEAFEFSNEIKALVKEIDIELKAGLADEDTSTASTARGKRICKRGSDCANFD